MKDFARTLEFQTQKGFDFIDFTEKVLSFVKESQIKNGLVNIQTLHTTAPLFLNENEPLLLEDFKKHLKELSPKDSSYGHNNLAIRTVNVCENECLNGHSHCLALHFPANLTLNVFDGKLQLGQWQRIFLAELDHARPRKVQLHIIGE